MTLTGDAVGTACKAEPTFRVQRRIFFDGSLLSSPTDEHCRSISLAGDGSFAPGSTTSTIRTPPPSAVALRRFRSSFALCASSQSCTTCESTSTSQARNYLKEVPFNNVTTVS
jgi:hypothetical protein